MPGEIEPNQPWTVEECILVRKKALNAMNARVNIIGMAGTPGDFWFQNYQRIYLAAGGLKHQMGDAGVDVGQ